MSTVGKRIKSYREKQNLTIEDLASRTAPQLRFQSRPLKRTTQYPSLRPLVKLARALGVRLGTFMDDQVSCDPLIVKLAEREEELTTHMAGEEPGMIFHSLGKGKTDRHMEPLFHRDAARVLQGHRPLSSHEGEEFIVVQSGKVRLIYGQEEVHPGAGRFRVLQLGRAPQHRLGRRRKGRNLRRPLFPRVGGRPERPDCFVAG